MPTISITTEELEALQSKVFEKLQDAEEAGRDARRKLKALHEALAEVQDAVIAKLPEGTIQPMSGGGKSDPPPEGP